MGGGENIVGMLLVFPSSKIRGHCTVDSICMSRIVLGQTGPLVRRLQIYRNLEVVSVDPSGEGKKDLQYRSF